MAVLAVAQTSLDRFNQLSRINLLSHFPVGLKQDLVV